MSYDYTMQLPSAPADHAVSYTWDSAVPVYPIHAQHKGQATDSDSDRDRSGYLGIGRNLYSFLKEFRHTQSNEDIFLWIRQLCIYQANTRERNHQVGLMSQVYTRASNAIVWLNDEGTHSGSVRPASDADPEAESASPTFFDRFLPDRWLKVVESNRFAPCLSRTPTSSPSALPVTTIEHRYFTRLWIIEELLLA
jgi:hypothetical protein